MTARARQTGPLVDAVFQLKESAHPVGIHIVGNGRTAQADGVAENLAQSQPQSLQFSACKTAGAATWLDTGVKQRFVGVDIPHARQ